MTEAHMTAESMIDRLAAIIDPVAYMPMSVHLTRTHKAAAMEKAREKARAVLHALREPDEGMKVMGGLALEKAMFEDQKELIFDVAGDGFTAMIDHILNESKSE